MRARRHDPERRERIIDAALRVVARDGIAGLSHRTAAAEADVPLGSTTYHFSSLDELLVAALRRTNENIAATVGRSPALAQPGADVADVLARLIGDWLTTGRARVELGYELYLAALRRPALRPVAAEWTEQVVAVLARHTGPADARALVAVVDGICLQTLLTDTPYDEERTRVILARILTPGGVRPQRGTGSPGSPAGG
ncbi:TetR/AcrR family transcriptional regulator [Streptomyces yaizuensis]|uniref:TetR family transcriptional regulator n=1 Tax=Streptomyces yaizuensis TaxID=2989713 RepID=A0ABQ5P7S1_9ACTN|nr:TetR family transcriptional regulator [Streptomyces sp. YSPA8]GLF98628.1 TetR family transcriptional regulator [Streptomyces sp. YSPA8]